MNEQNKQVAITFIEAMGRSDAATAASVLAPDAITVVKGFIKFSGVRNRDQMVEMIGAFKELVPSGLTPTINRVTAEGDRVVIEWEGNAILCNDESYRNQYCMVVTLRDGKIIEVTEYFCTALAERVLFPLVEAVW